MQSRNVVEKFEKTRRMERATMQNEKSKERGRKRNKTQRGKDHWGQIENSEAF